MSAGAVAHTIGADPTATSPGEASSTREAAMPTTRTRDDVLADIALMRHDAGRMVTTDPEFEAAHEVLNDLLDELERCQ